MFFINKNWILWVIIFVWKIQYFESYWKWVQFFESYQKKEFNSLSQFFSQKQHFESYFKKRFNSLSRFFEKKSLSHINKVLNSLSRIQKCSILWVVFKKKLNSSSLVRKRSSILSVILRKRLNSVSQISKRVHFFESYQQNEFKSLSHIKRNFKNSSTLWVIFWKKVQFEASYSRNEGFNSLRHVRRKKVQFCESIFFFLKKVPFFESNSKKVQFFVSYLKKKVPFESYLTKGILWVTFKKGPSLWLLVKKSKVYSLRKFSKKSLVIFKNKINSSSYIF